MDASPPPIPDIEVWSDQFDQALMEQRDRVRGFLHTQQGRLEQLEAKLVQQLHTLGEELGEGRRETQHARQELETQRQQIARESQSLAELKQELTSRQDEWRALQEVAHQQQQELAEFLRLQQNELKCRCEEIERRRPELDAAEAELDQQRQTLRKQQEQHQAELARLERLREELESQRSVLDNRDADEQSKLKRQLEEAQQRETRLAAELELYGQREAELTAQLEAARKEEGELNNELAIAHRRGAEIASELDTVKARCAELEQRTADASGDTSAEGLTDPAELAELRASSDAMSERLAETERQLEEAQRQLAEADSGAGSSISDDDMQRRYELAMDDVRSLKSENAELRKQLASASNTARPTVAPSSGGTLDWEAQKQRILAQLEADFADEEEDEEEVRQERIKIKEVIRTTDRVIAEKDREIEELRLLLDSQSANIGTTAVGAAALGEILDKDALVQEERENLKRLQEEWHEKLRQAEIDISVERAKIARERAQIEEKLRALDSHPDTTTDASGDSENKPTRGRWLARLGLKDDEEPSP